MLKQPVSKAITEGFLPRGIRLLLPATDLAVPVGLGRRAVPERVGGRCCPTGGYVETKTARLRGLWLGNWCCSGRQGLLESIL